MGTANFWEAPVRPQADAGANTPRALQQAVPAPHPELRLLASLRECLGKEGRVREVSQVPQQQGTGASPLSWLELFLLLSLLLELSPLASRPLPSTSSGPGAVLGAESMPLAPCVCPLGEVLSNLQGKNWAPIWGTLEERSKNSATVEAWPTL